MEHISKTILDLETSNLVSGFVLGMLRRRTNNCPESGRGLGHVTPTIFGSTVGYPSDSLASCLLIVQKRSAHFHPAWHTDSTPNCILLHVSCRICQKWGSSF